MPESLEQSRSSARRRLADLDMSRRFARWRSTRKVFYKYDVLASIRASSTKTAPEIGRAYVEVFELKAIAVGWDMRLPRPPRRKFIFAGLQGRRRDPRHRNDRTEMLYFAVAEHDHEGGIEVTASHNPKAQYKGMKIVRRRDARGGDTGLDISDQRATEDGARPRVEHGQSARKMATRRSRRGAVWAHERSGCCGWSSTPRTGWLAR